MAVLRSFGERDVCYEMDSCLGLAREHGVFLLKGGFMNKRCLMMEAGRMAAAALAFGLFFAVPAAADELVEDFEIEEFTEVFAEETQNIPGDTPPADTVIVVQTEPATEPLPGLIEETDVVPETEMATEKLTEKETEESFQEVLVNGLRFARDYKEVYEALRNADQRWWYTDTFMVEEEAAMDMGTADRKAAATEAAAAPAPANGSADYSTTNVRDSRVDEADIVKTDGTYLYILKEGKELIIARADRENTAVVSRTELTGYGDPDIYPVGRAVDMYVDGQNLIMIGQGYDELKNRKTSWMSYDSAYIQADTFDISDPSHPVLKGSVWQDGDYSQSRKIGDKVYLYSREYPILEDTYEKSDIVPVVNGQDVSAEDVCIPKYVTNASYLIVSSFSTAAPDAVIDTKVLVSGAEQLYVSEQSLYVMNVHYGTSTSRTEIVKFSCLDGEIRGVAATRIKGTVNDSFSIDEYEGNLRVLTTYTGSETGSLMQALSDLFGFDYYDPDYWTRHNALYILNENMNLRAKLGGIARDEEIRSARYFGNTVYFVTFRNTDPLFTADLTDPDAPRLTGELKVSGFSSYLHPFGEGLLLGIGYEANEETGVTTGLKLSVFDVSDPVNVREISRYVMDGVTWCPAIEDYKAIYAEADRRLAGFYLENRYLLFGYDAENGITRKLLYDFFDDMVNGREDYNTMRAVRIGDEMYLAGGSFITGFAMGADGSFAKNLVLQF